MKQLMKVLFTNTLKKIKNLKSTVSKILSKDINLKVRVNKKQLKLLNEINFLIENKLSIKEIENFLNIDLNRLDYQYFALNFSKYLYLFENLNIFILINYICFKEDSKKTYFSLMIKNFIYPTTLFVIAFFTLFIFKFNLIPLLSNEFNKTFLAVNVIFYFSIFIFILTIIVILFLTIIFSKDSSLIIFYNKIYNFKFFNLLQLYYLKILAYLLMKFSKQGLNTNKSLKLVNKFKSDPIIANIGYYFMHYLDLGNTLSKSILKLNVNDNFKNILLLCINTNNFTKILENYLIKINRDILEKINFYSKIYLMSAYVYIGIILIILYKVLFLPLTMIDVL